MRNIAVYLSLLMACSCASSSGGDDSAASAAGSAGTGEANSGASGAGGNASTLGSTGGSSNTGGNRAGNGNDDAGAGQTVGGSGAGGSKGLGGGSGNGGAAGSRGVGGGAGSSGAGGSNVIGDSGPATGELGVWQDVTPAGISLDPNYPYNAANFGVQDVLVDPLRPTDFYAFTCYSGVWKSSDYGLTWSKVSTGTNGAILDQGRMWTAAIASSAARQASAPPTLFTVDGYGSKPGLYKSTDGGVNFAYIDVSAAGLGNDVYALDVDPYDSQHMLMGFHGAGVAESVDGGATWTNRTGSVAGSSIYPFFVDTGNAATTRTTWITEPQWGNNSDGMWRTTNGGGAWSRLNDVEHWHGCAQAFNAGNGVIFAAGNSISPGSGVFKSTDAGATWTKVYGGSDNGVYGTKSHLYASFGWATGSAQYNGGAPQLAVGGATGSGWSSVTAPKAMWNGTKRAATSFDGKHSVIVSGNWGSGMWRYIEP